MAFLKGIIDSGGYVRIDRAVKFTGASEFTASAPWVTTWYVDGVNGNDGNTGKSPGASFATIQAAVTAAGRGDIIYIRPQDYVVGTGFRRYTEDVTTVLTQSDLSIIGVTSSLNAEYGVRWKFATAQCLTNIAPALHLENIGFFAEDATYGILVQNDGASNLKRGSDGMTIYNCVIKGKGVYVLSGGDGMTIERTRFHCKWDGTVAQINYSCSANPGRRFIVRNCEFQDGNGTAASGPFINIAGVMSELLIRDCYFGADPTGSVYITITSSTGSIANCHFACADVSTGRIVEGGVICTGIYDNGGLATAT